MIGIGARKLATLEPSASIVNNCSLPVINEMKTSFLPSGDGNGSKFWAWVICTGMEIALSAAAAACSHVSNLVRHHAREFGFVVRRQDQSRVYIEKSAWQREGIDHVRVDHLDRKWHF